MNRSTSTWFSTLGKLTLAALIALPLSFAASPDNMVKATGTNYYVDKNGSDSNNGTSLTTPFQTIGQAANVAQAGDTVYIRGGTYRETVTPANSGSAGNKIKFQNYNSESVVVSGADLVTGWSQDSGNIYKAPMNWNLGPGNQVFVDGSLIDEARWPNQVNTLMQPTRSGVDSGSLSTIVDSALSGADGFWNGATLWIVSGYRYRAITSTVTGYDATNKRLTFNNLTTSSGYAASPGDGYYLSGIKGALDVEKEWWYDSANAMLYTWVPGGGDPTSHTVEAKKRINAFDLSGKSYVEINGLQIFASTIKMDSSTNNCLIQSIVAKYLSHNKESTGYGAGEQDNLGIILDGSYNVIRDSEIAYSSGNLVIMKGNYNQLVNNYIHEGQYMAYGGVVNLAGSNSLVSHNTIRDSGRAIVTSNNIKANQIQYNDMYNGGWVTEDTGVFYGGGDGQQTEVHHNYFHDMKSPSLGVGFYLDNYNSNYIVHHNVTWNSAGLQFNTPSNYNLVYNNTAWTGATTIQAWGNTFATDMHGDRFFNNIIKGYDPEVTSYSKHGSEITSSPVFVNEATRDYSLLSTSPARDAGIVIPGITDNVTDSLPDIGAYEYGQTPWTAGHNFSSPPNPTYGLNLTTPYMNKVVNGGFEFGDLSSWTKTDANNAVAVNQSHWGLAANQGMSRSNLYGAKLSGSVDGLEQTITGLQPNTNYMAAGWLRSPAGDSVSFGVKNYGGTDKSFASSSSTWTFIKVPFKTGASDTSATIYFKKTSGTGEVYVDDAGLTPDPTVYSSLYSFDGFESGLGNWVTGSGTATLSTAQAHSGSNSYIVDQDSDIISQKFDSTITNKIVSMWFYDNAASTNMQVQAFVDDSVSSRAIGVNTPTSTTKYIYRVNGTYTASTITRTTGWHEFKWDYTSGTKVDMYIDGVLVASPTGVTGFNQVSIGDAWSGNATTTYYDDITIQDLTPFTFDGFESGLGNWVTTAGTATLSTAQAHSGSNSYIMNEDSDVIQHIFPSTLSNKIVTMWFYDDAASTNMQVSGSMNNSVSSQALGVNTPTSTTNYSYRVGGTHTATSIARTTGWHEFKWDYTSGTKVDMYIDGTLVASPTGVTGFNQISIGDSSTGNTTTTYFDDVNIADPPPFTFFDGFESGLGNWTTSAGTATVSTAQAHSGSYSYIVDQDSDIILKTFANLNKVVTIWFYDNAASTNMQVQAFVDNGVTGRALGVNTPTSTTKYSYRLGGTYTATSITRTTGWHEFKWDYTTGTKVDMYIDGTLVASPTGVTAFNKISIGDAWSGNITTTYYDDINIQ